MKGCLLHSAQAAAQVMSTDSPNVPVGVSLFWTVYSLRLIFVSENFYRSFKLLPCSMPIVF